eukprot:NODE_5561_length_572_cov_221.148936.p1 GENE.NODE_5561_length_572_cov_221.148936~~NODE_5561_length_572_cov_221.148936.p1  ORF type:complete len:156 (+),score=47.79 NODE_5561_length_572_cov_221.148936:3-470(+)
MGAFWTSTMCIFLLTYGFIYIALICVGWRGVPGPKIMMTAVGLVIVIGTVIDGWVFGRKSQVLQRAFASWNFLVLVGVVEAIYLLGLRFSWWSYPQGFRAVGSWPPQQERDDPAQGDRVHSDTWADVLLAGSRPQRPPVQQENSNWGPAFIEPAE